MGTRYPLLLMALALTLTLGCTGAMMGTPKSEVGPQMLSESDFLILEEMQQTGKGLAYHLLHYEPVVGKFAAAILGNDATSQGEWLKVVLETPYSIASTRVHESKQNYLQVDFAALRSELAPLDSCYLVADFAGREGTSAGIVQRLEDRDPNEGALTGRKVIENLVLVVDGTPVQPSSKEPLSNGGLRASFPISLFDCTQRAPDIKIAVVFEVDGGSSGKKEIDLPGRKLRTLK